MQKSFCGLNPRGPIGKIILLWLFQGSQFENQSTRRGEPMKVTVCFCGPETPNEPFQNFDKKGQFHPYFIH